MVFGTYVGENMFSRAIRLLESGLIDLNPVISRVVPLEDCVSAFDRGRISDLATIGKRRALGT